MPKRGAAPAAQPAPPKPTLEDEETPAETVHEGGTTAEDTADEAQAAPPARKGGRRAATPTKSTNTADEAAPEATEEPKKPTRRGGAKAKEFEFTDIDAEEITFDDLDSSNDYVSVLYYGQEGTTKTTSALRASLLTDCPGNVLLINAEGGAKKDPLVDMGVDASRVKVWPPKGKRVTFDGLERLYYKIADDLDKDVSSWVAVVWDSGTEIVATLLDQVVEHVIAEQREIIEKTNGRAGNIKLRDRFDNDRDDFRKMSNQVRSLLRKYRYLPCHFIVTALLRVDEEGDRVKRMVYSPAVTPALQSDLLGYVDVVAYCKATRDKDNKPVYYAQTVPEKNDRAKDRYHRLPAEMVDPSFDRMIEYIRGELTEADDPIQRKMPGYELPAKRDPAEATGHEPVEEAEPAAKPTPARAARASGRKLPAKKPAPAKGGTASARPAVGASDDPPF
jgi:hypothetical protein